MIGINMKNNFFDKDLRFGRIDYESDCYSFSRVLLVSPLRLFLVVVGGLSLGRFFFILPRTLCHGHRCI